MEKIKIILVFVFIAVLSSCQTYKEERTDIDTGNIKVSKSVEIPKDENAAPVAGFAEAQNADRIITFSGIGDKVHIKYGQTVNFIYDGINPEQTYIKYESTDDGYNLELANRNDPVVVRFWNLCQNYVVASPSLTNIDIAPNLNLEQIVWTPRADGTWEVRIGTVERGCKSQALQELQKLRTKEYEKNLPRK